MIIGDALDALWSLGQAGIAWLLIAAAAGTALIFGTIAGVSLACRALWRAAHPRRRRTS